MRDYLNAAENGQFMVILAVLQSLEGKRNSGIDGPKIGTILEQWQGRGNMTKEERRSLKTAETYLKKFTDSVYNRLSQKEQETIDKKTMKFDFRLIDDFTMKQIFREIDDRMVNAVVPRNQFYNWCEKIMKVECNGCTKNWNECELHQVFEDNFVSESGFDCENCKYAYHLNE